MNASTGTSGAVSAVRMYALAPLREQSAHQFATTCTYAHDTGWWGSDDRCSTDQLEQDKLDTPPRLELGAGPAPILIDHHGGFVTFVTPETAGPQW